MVVYTSRLLSLLGNYLDSLHVRIGLGSLMSFFCAIQMLISRPQPFGQQVQVAPLSRFDRRIGQCLPVCHHPFPLLHWLHIVWPWRRACAIVVAANPCPASKGVHPMAELNVVLIANWKAGNAIIFNCLYSWSDNFRIIDPIDWLTLSQIEFPLGL